LYEHGHLDEARDQFRKVKKAFVESGGDADRHVSCSEVEDWNRRY
jgi:hypothetical protein